MARARPPQAAVLSSTFRCRKGRVPVSSVSTTSCAPKAAATMPGRPVPAPSSTTRRPRTSSGCVMRCVAKARAAGHTQNPVLSSEEALQASSPHWDGLCSTVMGTGSAGCSKLTIASLHMGPLKKSLSSCSSVKLSITYPSFGKAELTKATSRSSAPTRITWMRSSNPRELVWFRKNSTLAAVANDTDTNSPLGRRRVLTIARQQASRCSGLSIASKVPLSTTTVAEQSSTVSSTLQSSSATTIRLFPSWFLRKAPTSGSTSTNIRSAC
mmetsp:Transcript_51608/g.102526  ORF Transcript_51608/g.102526 Transcript_51608/m.102526 type:complete len:269 (+) Transcript_51608:460-1266(+)